MLYFAIELDEESIRKEKEIDLEAAYLCLEDNFAQKDISLDHTEGKVRYYTRNIDRHDFEYLWLVNASFRQFSWFLRYVRIWKFLDIDEENGSVRTEKDLIREWKL